MCTCSLQFIVSYPSTSAKESTTTRSGNQDSNEANNGDSAEEGNGEAWAAEKDEVTTISTSSTPAEIAATRALDRGTGMDPLSLEVVDELLVVHGFAQQPDSQQQSQLKGAAGPVAPAPPEQQFTILLNKFNTVKDHVSVNPSMLLSAIYKMLISK